jgi:hypothetical protein
LIAVLFRALAWPSLYILMESDLNTLFDSNVLVKFANDTSLLVAENYEVSLQQQEFAHVQEWAKSNKMIINYAKTKEIVFSPAAPE